MESVAANFDPEGDDQERLLKLRDQADSFVNRQKSMKSEGTAKVRKIGLRRFFRWQGVSHPSEMTSFDVEDFIIYLSDESQQDYSSATVKSSYFGLRKFFDYLEDRGEIETNPAAEVSLSDFSSLSGNGDSKKSTELKAQDGIIYLTAEEVAQLAEHSGEAPGNPVRNELIIKLLFQTGLRRGEFCAIELEDIDRDRRSINVRAEKTYRNRVVGYQPSLDFLMNLWIDRGYRDSVLTAADSEYLFPTKNSVKISTTVLNRVVKDSAEAAGIQAAVYEDTAGHSRTKVTTHALRHSFAVESLKQGMDVRSLQKLMGHAKMETTERYLDVTDDDVLEKVSQFGPDSSA